MNMPFAIPDWLPWWVPLVLLVPAYLYVVHLWHSRLVTDRLFKMLVAFSFVFLTLTTKMFCGVFLSQVMTSVGFINYGMLLLPAAIFRAAHCLQRLEVAAESIASAKA